MIEKLWIRNYALIDKMELNFSPGLNVITGETGTGKSIMLKGLGLILGKRADKEAIRNPDQKIIVEGTFDITPYGLENFFENHDLDWEARTLIRREITPSGKSRAFVNDTPVKLEILEQLGEKLVDIHSQHQQKLLQDKHFRFNFLDAMADTAELRKEFSELLRQYRKLQARYDELTQQKQALDEQARYREFQLRELSLVDWNKNWEEVEKELKKYDNQEEILEKWAEIQTHFTQEDLGVEDRFRRIKNLLSDIASKDPAWQALAERAENLLPELTELYYDMEEAAQIYFLMDRSKKIRLEEELNRLYELMRKHRVHTPEELKNLYEKWQAETRDASRLEEETQELKHSLDQLRERLEKLAAVLHERRSEAIDRIERETEKHLAELGMPHSRIRFRLRPRNDFDIFGKDDLDILLSADKGKTYGEIKKTASGGELSRLMLVMKYLLSQKKHLPAIVFDEIDAGISGEIARKTASMLKQMSRHMQVITVTHLPQTAVAGDKHFKVYKTERNGIVYSDVKEITGEERVREIAEMLEGKPPSESAVRHARHLLKQG